MARIDYVQWCVCICVCVCACIPGPPVRHRAGRGGWPPCGPQSGATVETEAPSPSFFWKGRTLSADPSRGMLRAGSQLSNILWSSPQLTCGQPGVQRLARPGGAAGGQWTGGKASVKSDPRLSPSAGQASGGSCSFQPGEGNGPGGRACWAGQQEKKVFTRKPDGETSLSTLEENWGALGNKDRGLQVFGLNISEEGHFGRT